jgi:two-component system, OmpR family, sensor kinase
MSRLFWKFLLFFMLAQLLSTACAMAFWLRHGVHLPRPPVQVMAGGVFASLGVASLLAWYVSKPIRALRRALKAAAHGDLDMRIAGHVARRRDELADLGRDFDIMAARLKSLIHGQRRLLHHVSHEMRSPLARLQAAVGLVRQNRNYVDASIDRVERESIRMENLVDELLTLSRLEAGIAIRQKESVNVAEVLGDVVSDATFELNARAGSVAFDVRIEPLQFARITGNAELLHRAFENVVRNSARYTPSGGQIHIVGEYDGSQREIRLMIADEGPGVRTAELASIFEPFFRGQSAEAASGHGLGLAITQAVIQSHGGRVSACNRASGGLAVEICLPA